MKAQVARELRKEYEKKVNNLCKCLVIWMMNKKNDPDKALSPVLIKQIEETQAIEDKAKAATHLSDRAWRDIYEITSNYFCSTLYFELKRKKLSAREFNKIIERETKEKWSDNHLEPNFWDRFYFETLRAADDDLRCPK